MLRFLKALWDWIIGTGAKASPAWDAMDLASAKEKMRGHRPGEMVELTERELRALQDDFTRHLDAHL